MRARAGTAAVLFSCLLCFGAGGERSASFYEEAPALAAQVKLGKLPPVDERLPPNPMLVESSERGRYADPGNETTWHMAMRGSSDHALLIRTIGYENLMRWTPDWSRSIPNVAQSVAASADATEFKFVLRSGMKWSDGHPFTADDIFFWYEDILLNPALSPSTPFWLKAGDKPVQVTKINDTTVVFRFAVPNSLFLALLAAPEGAEPTSYPKHYLSKFLPRYNKSLEGTNWVEGFHAAFGMPGNIDDSTRWAHHQVPTLNAWILTGDYGSADPLIAVRNPYYWKIDTAGKQLPYIDRVLFKIVKERRDVADLALQGFIDMQMRHVRCCGEEILAARPEYKPLKIIATETNELVIGFNLNIADPTLHQIFNQRDFRIAMSIGMDRNKIIHGDPAFVAWPVAALPESRHYNERLATQYIEFDPERANGMLDALGYYRRDAAGWRLGPGGKPIAFTIDTHADDGRIEWLKSAVADWRALGIDITARVVDREVYMRRLMDGEFDALAYSGDGGIDVIIFPSDFIPLGIQSAWGLRWWRWYENKEDPRAEVPPPPVQKQFELYDQIKATTDPDVQQGLMRQILDIYADELYALGIARNTYDTAVVRRTFRNAPDFFLSAWSYPEPAPTNPAQYFFSE
jgi:peptide/nickel transport system substrate-binding protein